MALRKSLKATMKAAFVDELGGADAIRYGTLPVPGFGEWDVLLKVTAVTVNPVDAIIRSGRFATALPFPFILSRDVVGTVLACGSAVQDFRIGQAVWSNSMGHGGRQGTAAEFAAVRADRLYPLPAGVDPIRAVALLHPAATAYLALHRHAKIQPGEHLYVGGGAGHVGSALIVQAVRAGARVLASAAARDRQYCLDLGVEAVLDYRSPSFAADLADAVVGPGLDVHIETSGHHDLALAVSTLALRGRIVLLAGGGAEPVLPTGKLYTRDASILGFAISNASVPELADAAAAVNALLIGDVLRPRNVQVLPLSGMRRAHQRMEAGDVRGTRLVLMPQ